MFFSGLVQSAGNQVNIHLLNNFLPHFNAGCDSNVILQRLIFLTAYDLMYVLHHIYNDTITFSVFRVVQAFTEN